MDLPLNTAPALIMHIDLDSCFATIEQQANPLLRNKPIAVAAYATSYGCILSPSIEAKRYGIKTGMRVGDAKMIYPNLIVLTPDPPKYRDVHQRFMKIFRTYSPDVVAKSIDEAVINFSSFKNLYFYTKKLLCYSEVQVRRDDRKRILSIIAKEIKQRMHSEIGEWISCSIGIGTNRFWAKTGASVYKPNGLVIINHETIREILKHMTLTDLNGINVRNTLRLNRYGIYTPLQFLDAPLIKLQKQVFQSITGYYWYMRLRGWEVDQAEFERKSYGQQYHLTKSTDNEQELLGLLLKLCEKMGRRLRKANCSAKGVHLSCAYRDRTYWHHGQTFHEELHTTFDLFEKARFIFYQQPEKKVISLLSVSCFSLQEVQFFQDELFDEKKGKRLKISKTLDDIHDKYGEYLVHPALMIHMKDKVLDRVAFGKSGIGD